MVYKSFFKKITSGMMSSLIAVFLLCSASFAQNSPLAIKGDQTAFGNLKVVSQYGHVVFADQPDKTTVGMFKDMGIKMVINIRNESENEGFDERKAVEAEGMAYVQIPYMKGRAINGDAADELLSLIEMTAKSGNKIMLHCGHSQRVGSVLAVALYKAGYSREKAGEIATDAGMTSEFITKIHNDYMDTLK